MKTQTMIFKYSLISCPWWITSIAFFINLNCYALALGETQDLPFHTGEKITLQVRWSFILAGEATMELLPSTNINGEDSYHLLLTARSSKIVDIFYKVRDRIEAYTDLNMTHSLLYIESNQGKSPKDTAINFDWEKQEAQYSRTGEREKRTPISIMPGTFDPLSVFYAFRLNDLKENNEITIPATDGNKMVLGKINVIKKETIKVLGISYDTFLVEAELGELGGVFEKSKDAKLQIWVTADNRRIPVRIKSKMTVGSFVAELISYNEGVTSPIPDSGSNDIK
jgi:hypothetical protein